MEHWIHDAITREEAEHILHNGERNSEYRMIGQLDGPRVYFLFAESLQRNIRMCYRWFWAPELPIIVFKRTGATFWYA